MAEQKTQAPAGGLKDAPQRELREVAPANRGKAVQMTGPGGTVVTVSEDMVDTMKAAGYKAAAAKSTSK